MKIRILSICLLILTLLLASCGGADPQPAALAGEEAAPAVESAPEEEPTEAVNGAALNITGIWQGVLMHELVEGGCPPTPTQQGTVSIEQVGPAVTMQFGEGFTCSPLEACDFTGIVEGMNYTASNGGIADSEGGTYTTTMTVTFSPDAESATGSGTSTYQHPEMQCEWITSLSLIRTGGD